MSEVCVAIAGARPLRMTDVFVPPAHGEWLAANVPGCIVKINDAPGHLRANPEQAGSRARRPSSWMSSSSVR
jgi:hypothetical protein